MKIDMGSRNARLADLACSIAILLFGIYRVWSQWPEPTLWSWSFLAFGALSIVAWVFNPLEKIQTHIFRSVVKTRN
jgi:uncharacterized membrane protein